MHRVRLIRTWRGLLVAGSSREQGMHTHARIRADYDCAATKSEATCGACAVILCPIECVCVCGHCARVPLNQWCLRAFLITVIFFPRQAFRFCISFVRATAKRAHICECTMHRLLALRLRVCMLSADSL